MTFFCPMCGSSESSLAEEGIELALIRSAPPVSLSALAERN